MFIGDNESGKSTILLAQDLVLRDSRHRVEALGGEALLSQSAVRRFLVSERRAVLLPVLTANVILSEGGAPDLNGRQNLTGLDANGLKMRIAPMTEGYGQDIHHVLQQNPDNFPYEYYAFGSVHSPAVILLALDAICAICCSNSVRIDNDPATQEYPPTVYSVNVPVAESFFSSLKK